MMTEREGSAHGAAARELLIDRQLPRFGEPDYGKVATSFLVLPYGPGRSLLCTETRTATTDPVSASRFRRYWKVIGPFARYIMRHWLMLAKQHAEQG